ncbi:MAG: hypothetical protein A2061_01790 [Gallionellales bacterium GWA2_59_43]|nr:MAG: hypothetical protein A2061_01790 [Gallionellales bacterium GWA2_59_43]
MSTKNSTARKTADEIQKSAGKVKKTSVRLVRHARIIMDPVAKPKHFSVAAIRNAVRLVVDNK